MPPRLPLTRVHAFPQGFIYAQAGAAAISVLTEPTWFKGTLTDMRDVRKRVADMPDRPAVLRKDFLIDEYMVYEARVYGADTVLLIVAVLEEPLLKSLIACSRSLGMEPLVEVPPPLPRTATHDDGTDDGGVESLVEAALHLGGPESLGLIAPGRASRLRPLCLRTCPPTIEP